MNNPVIPVPRSLAVSWIVAVAQSDIQNTVFLAS